MKVLSLFSGVGGFDMGLENAGMETVFQCEWDKHANTILHRHWSAVPKWEDVSTLTGKHILANAPVIDVVAWGSPCQDLSVAGKRAGLEGGRSNLFHEGIRIIKELREETNGQYPRISIWENVVGALNSNRGADFGIIIDEMAEAGAMVIEWAVLDAQYFGVPQRRRRVFVIAIFDPVLANNCPDPLLPVAESLPRHLAKGKPKRQSAARTLTEGTGTDGAIVNAIGASLYHHGTVVNQDANSGHMIVEQEVVGTLTVSDLVKQVNNEIINKGLLQVVENRQPFTSSSFAGYEEGVGTLRSNGGDLGGGSETLVTEPVAYHFDSLSSNSMKSSNPDSGVNQVDQARTLDTWRPDPSLNQGGLAIVEPMLIDGTRVDDVRVYEPPVQTLKERMGTGGNNVPMLAFDTQFGSNANVTENVAPTLKSSQAPPSVAYGITGNAIGRQDHNGPNGPSHTPEGGPMFTLTSTDIHAVVQEEPTVFQPGTMVRLNGGVWEGIVPTLRAESKRGDNEPHILVNENITSPTLTAYNMDSRSPQSEEQQRIVNAVFETTMAVRRLTPLECERLMGWPDDHTRYKADGTEQADTHRYKQCGNGVASPVAQWIGKHLIKLEQQSLPLPTPPIT